ncbi:Ribosomal RNA small subunit methyltransferase E [Alphaproteobacteria bacterium]
MSDIRLYIDCGITHNKQIVLKEYHAHYLCNVMRCKKGEQIRIFNAIDLEWIAAIDSVISGRHVTLLVVDKYPALPPPTQPHYILQKQFTPVVTLVFAPIKAFTPSLIAQKATELGIDAVFPIITERTIITKVRHDKLLSSVIEGIEQCGRLAIPQIYLCTSFKNFCTFLCNQISECTKDTIDIVLFFHGTHNKSETIVSPAQLPQTIAKSVLPYNGVMEGVHKVNYIIIIGPEGGFTEKEVGMITAINTPVIIVTLGNLTLRAETATIAAISSVKAVLNLY